ncbi:MAG: AAA family ATPase [Candidatus Geothermarchaeales archaeon]
MVRAIGFLGKGGTGKTTLTALFLRCLIEDNREGILAIDADPNECLPNVLGVRRYVRLSDIVKTFEGKSINPEQFEDRFREMLLRNEQDGYDLIVMGRGETRGCYCYINLLLKSSFERNVLKGPYSYDYVLMDCEAGIEHISRTTSTSIDAAVVVTDSSKMGLDTIERIKNVSNEVESDVKSFYVVANRVQSEKVLSMIEEKARKLGMVYLGNIPYDPLLEEFNFEGRSLLELPIDSKAYRESGNMLEGIFYSLSG